MYNLAIYVLYFMMALSQRNNSCEFMADRMCWILPFIREKNDSMPVCSIERMCLKIVSGSREFPGSQIAGMLQFISVSRGTPSEC